MNNFSSFSTQHIGYLERSYLEHVEEIPDDLFNQCWLSKNDKVEFIKIIGISNFWKKYKAKFSAVRYLMQDFYSGLYAEKIPLIYLIIGESSRINLFVGTYSSDNAENKESDLQNNLSTLKTSLQSAYPSIEFCVSLSTSDVELLEMVTMRLNRAALMTGTPTVKADTEEIRIEQIERLIRGLYSTNEKNARWAYIVTAVPVITNEVTCLYNTTLNELRILSDAKQISVTENAIAERYDSLLRVFLQKLELGKSQGMWHVVTGLLTETEKKLRHGQAILKSVFSGLESRPDPIRVLRCPPIRNTLNQLIHATIPAPKGPGLVRYPYKYLSLLNAQEVASLTHLPTEEMPGYFVRDYARFDVASHHVSRQTPAIQIGEVIDRGRPMGYSYQLDLEQLNRHGLVVGTTGSGKTNTIFHILQQVWRTKVPFLAIEPAKTEYRKLMHSPEFSSELQIFTLADEMTSPLRLNPFQIRPGVSVQTHIDYLKSVFNASFTMYGPMPYVLERCIHEIYEDKGWDLATGENARGIHPKAQPTLTDLYLKIEELVDGLGYEAKITMDIKSALKTRINSLRIGSKGLMLDVNLSTPIEILLQKPTILELESIGDDDEKAFVIGLLLTMLNEHYISQGIREGEGLSHLTIVEEAHRLFKYVTPFSGTEIANVRGKAVETFCNILSEIRAYGEGFIIVEQIPTKLAADIIKNTNLKLMHRIVSGDDREVMGATMNLDEDQKQRVASLTVGEAVTYSEGDDRSILVKVPYSKIATTGISKTEEIYQIRQIMKRGDEATENKLLPQAGGLIYQEQLRKYGKLARQVVENSEFREIMARYIISTVVYPQALIEDFLNLVQFVNKFRKLDSGSPILSFVLVRGIQDYFDRRGKQYGWTYETVERLTSMFLGLMFSTAFKRFHQEVMNQALTEKEIQQVKNFQVDYQHQCQLTYWPFAGCQMSCPKKQCLYRYNIEPLLNDRRLDNNITNALGKYSGDDIWKQVAHTCNVAQRRICIESISQKEKCKLSLCFVIQKMEVMPYLDSHLRNKVVVNMMKLLDR
ncbi:MAG: ATP-binding protein [Moorea sp. SIO1G6]|uniref:ATP-binding protein n=1 Tax=Moorena sp. SIO1G6 TaxID=2607840 RepID=UPI0013C0D4DD|nr:DUF87 domain-containing protein [Moorena sp. SIO1G6]NET67903.1 ATP-binding protein [Moorena sp. SIO1G6]